MSISDANMITDHAKELLAENAELRRRLENTEDTLRREIRKGFKPCPHCGKQQQ